ncbi:DUF423 domain-containing protein [Paraglaciecola agarilytica]|jgi:uncharacterized membrane protein YgdD (TMEM256/DUF423 family)|uniref:DUF423 domain-containing protein n=2 Tax=Paraglaciecola chathamensis TaxID=368405 RepID=A0A8H9M0Y3_9ALTE|nr:MULTISPECIES: DUF423 domain-containing protein [Paraglaciecola]AEE23006.1 protein of unknown function DUF423 [Glaciecola sp. 4H-3-7+YE-5]MBJ2137144.1 DUF423 domain-containing protein [Paraglaciecola chathamensis]MBU3019681.1 DUF423 domain-containing protein [Paraglaciecola agarilytica]MDO6841053.1 DUF423 domain-containing protein [Paraglaciecola chathamensis]GAC05319.1 hypothetical protein GAGA_2468 [Paraglaciecola agarilytica NO2]
MKIYLVIGTVSAMLAVILGAFAAHGLKNQLSEQLLAVFQTGVQYQMYHSLGLILLVLTAQFMPSAQLVWSAGFMSAGIVLFSGSLYLLAITGIKWFGPVTPIGGLCFIIAWGLFIFAAFKGLKL